MRVDTTSLGLSADEARAPAFLASMGIYVFKYDVIEQAAGRRLFAVDFGREIIPASIQRYNVQALSVQRLLGRHRNDLAPSIRRIST